MNEKSGLEPSASGFHSWAVYNPAIRKAYLKDPVIHTALPFEKVSDRLTMVGNGAAAEWKNLR